MPEFSSGAAVRFLPLRQTSEWRDMEKVGPEERCSCVYLGYCYLKEDGRNAFFFQ
jgi:hypothetical protein